jgi:hypothetical protein
MAEYEGRKGPRQGTEGVQHDQDKVGLKKQIGKESHDGIEVTSGKEATKLYER